MIYLAANYVRKPSWSVSGVFIRSPLVRLAAAVPTIGYFVLYGDAFREMFDFTASFGAEYLLFSAQTKVRLVYYGGVLIGLALLLYIWRCPDICKRLFSEIDAKTEYSTVGSPWDVSLGDYKSNLSNHGEKLKPFPIELKTNFYGLMMRMIVDTPEHEVPAFFPEDHVFPEVSKEFNLIPTETAELSKLFQKHWHKRNDAAARNELLMMYDWLRSQGVKDTDRTAQHMSYFRDLYVSLFRVKSRTRPVSQWIVFSLSLAGVLIAALPAIDVFLQVVLTDTGLLQFFAHSAT